MSELLSLPSCAADLNLSPQRKREKLFEALLNQLEAVARDQPVLMVFEDAHWIDPTSRELLDLAADRVRRLQVLLAITFRPEFQPPWGGRAHVTSLALNRLGERAGEALVQTLAGNGGLTAEMVAEIVERTDGVPLFIEELTKAVLESAGQGDRVAAVLGTASQTALSVPATLHASLMARLDRLGPAAKEIAQIGAVLGREFGYALIEPVAQRPERELHAALDQLNEAGLLFCRGVPPHASYLFKHALVQDAAYSTLLRGRRQELHARVVVALEQHFADLVERQPELLAHHLTAAGDTERAIDQWLKAGQRAAARSAHTEAISDLERGLALVGALPEDRMRIGREVDLRLALGLSSMTVRGASSRETLQAYERASELAEMRSDARQLFQAVHGIWQTHASSGRVRTARPFSDQLLTLTDLGADRGLRLQAHHSAWTTDWWSGELVSADRHAEAGRDLYDAKEHLSHRHLYGGHDPGVCARQVGANSGWLLGYPDKGLALGRETLELAGRITHPFSLYVALGFVATLHLNRREPELVLHLVDQAAALAAEQRFAERVQRGLLRGTALAMQGATDDAVRCLQEALAQLDQRGATLYRSFGLASLAEALTRQGEHRAALAAVGEGLDTLAATGERWWETELHRVHGTVLMAKNQLGQSEACFRQAIRIAAGPTSKIVGIARCPRSGPAVGRPEPPRRSPRSARAGLRLVHRGVRHRRLGRGEGAARRTNLSCWRPEANGCFPIDPTIRWRGHERRLRVDLRH